MKIINNEESHSVDFSFSSTSHMRLISSLRSLSRSPPSLWFIPHIRYRDFQRGSSSMSTVTRRSAILVSPAKNSTHMGFYMNRRFVKYKFLKLFSSLYTHFYANSSFVQLVTFYVCFAKSRFDVFCLGFTLRHTRKFRQNCIRIKLR
jgi:hypothetical protein